MKNDCFLVFILEYLFLKVLATSHQYTSYGNSYSIGRWSLQLYYFLIIRMKDMDETMLWTCFKIIQDDAKIHQTVGLVCVLFYMHTRLY